MLSKSERLSKEFIETAVAPHLRAIGAVGEFLQGELPNSSIQKREVLFSNQSRIIALPANPETARSYEGDLLLDEFAFHKKGREIYIAATPSITRGFKLKIISTPNGMQGTYYDLANEAGLVDGKVRNKKWSPHRVSILDAIKQGFCDRYGNVVNSKDIRALCLDEEMWLQEYMCQFLSTAQQWISPALFESCVDDGALSGVPQGEWERQLFGGWDIARHKDLSIIWLLELVGDVTWTRGVIDLSNMSMPDQIREGSAIMALCRRMVIDQSGMGLAIAETLSERFWGRVEGITFTQQVKEALAVHAKNRMQQAKSRIPDDDRIRYSFRSVQKTTTATGMARFDAEHDEVHGHADHWWAFAMAEQAAGQPIVLGVVESLKQEQNARAMDKLARVKGNSVLTTAKATQLVKPVTVPQAPKCPNCGNSNLIVKVGKAQRCNGCGTQFGGPTQRPTLPSRSA